ncbi:hypothetical protein D3C83_218210 [compost metagenome]
MEDGVRTVFLEDVMNPLAVAYVGDHRDDPHIGEGKRQLLEDVENRVLAMA